MHLHRWLTSLVLLPVLILLLLLGGAHLFALLIAAVCCFSLREYYRIVWKTDRRPFVRSVSILGYVLGPAIVLGAHFFPLHWLLPLFSLSIILPSWVCMRHFQADAGIPSVLALHALAMVYIPSALACLILIRHGAFGVQWVFLIIFVVFSGDISAYYVGSWWGRRKLCPAVSPGKTVEGALGGLGANLIVGFAAAEMLLPELPAGRAAFSFIAIGVAGQLGDLFESMLKRSAGVKDSGTLLPGHGGMLDRIDALLFAAPVALALVRYLT